MPVQDMSQPAGNGASIDQRHVIKKAELPPHVPNTGAWGRTFIDFGKDRESKLSFEELRSSKDVPAMDYTKWCRARASSAEGYLPDFAQYLLFMEQLESLENFKEGPFIPGTSTRRQYKQWMI